MAYKEGHLEITSQVRAVPLGQKRKRERPKPLGNCLLKSTPQSRTVPTRLKSPPCSPPTSSFPVLPQPASARLTTRKSPTAAASRPRAKKSSRKPQTLPTTPPAATSRPRTKKTSRK